MSSALLTISPLLAAEETRHLPSHVPLTIIAVMFYMLMMAPLRRERQQHVSMLEGLKKNDNVVTIGGLKGTVTNVKDNEVTLRVDDSNNTRIRVLKSSISRIDPGDKPEKD